MRSRAKKYVGAGSDAPATDNAGRSRAQVISSGHWGYPRQSAVTCHSSSLAPQASPGAHGEHSAERARNICPIA